MLYERLGYFRAWLQFTFACNNRNLLPYSLRAEKPNLCVDRARYQPKVFSACYRNVPILPSWRRVPSRAGVPEKRVACEAAAAQHNARCPRNALLVSLQSKLTNEKRMR
jgi:hypothetical protein